MPAPTLRNRLGPLLIVAAMNLACSSTGTPPAVPARVELLRTPVPLRLELPSNYALRTDVLEPIYTFEVAREPTAPLSRFTTLTIVVQPNTTRYCAPGAGQEIPAAFPAWSTVWRVCVAGGGRGLAWEVHVPMAAGGTLHVFIVGPDAEEAANLRAIAETLAPH